MTNYEKYLTTKPIGLYTTADIAKKYGFTRKRVQNLCKLFGFTKDSAGIYLLHDKELTTFAAFVKMIDLENAPHKEQ